MTRGFLIGATAGRTTLTGEGLQHADGHSPILAATMPHVVHYDPAYGYEIRHIVRDGLLIEYLSRSEHGGLEPVGFRERSVLQLGRSCGFNETHARTVERLALELPRHRDEERPAERRQVEAQVPARGRHVRAAQDVAEDDPIADRGAAVDRLRERHVKRDPRASRVDGRDRQRPGDRAREGEGAR